jgi:hypothetical protein
MTSPVAATISSTGISAPNFATILNYFTTQYLSIFGADSYLGNDSQDGQLLGVISQAVSDCNSSAVGVYSSFSPTTAIGTGLASNVKINGLKPIAGSFSTCPGLVCGGTAGTPLTGAMASDSNGNLWAIPDGTVIGPNGTVTVTAVCQTLGAIVAAANSINQIATPILNWQTVNNPSNAAITGNGVETDAALRVRQSNSVSLPSTTLFDGITAAIQQVPGVTRVTPYENNTNTTNSNSIPAKTLCFVVEGGSVAAIGSAIALKIPPATPTFGSTPFTYTDALGTVRTINIQIATEATATANITVHGLSGWSTATEVVILAAVSAYFQSVPIGGTINVASVILAAMLVGTPYFGTFLVKSAQININGGSYQSTDIALAFSTAAQAGVSTVTPV